MQAKRVRLSYRCQQLRTNKIKYNYRFLRPAVLDLYDAITNGQFTTLQRQANEQTVLVYLDPGKFYCSQWSSTSADQDNGCQLYSELYKNLAVLHVALGIVHPF